MTISATAAAGNRRAAYEAAHPDTAITPPDHDHRSDSCTPLWIARRDGKILAAEYGLGALLDDLEWLEAGRMSGTRPDPAEAVPGE
jgi:hypothetical protein